MNKGKWSYHPNWNFGVKNFKITNFRLNNIFSTIFYGFYGFTARIFDILWLLLKCGDFTRIRHFRNIPMNIGQMVSMTHHIWLTEWLIHTKMKNNHFREQESHESTRIFRAWSISWILIIHNRDKWTRL